VLVLFRLGAESVRLTDRDNKSVWLMAQHAQDNCTGVGGSCLPEAAVLDWAKLPPLVCYRAAVSQYW
jgi:hypothetical protein